jgi:hypothetical protein
VQEGKVKSRVEMSRLVTCRETLASLVDFNLHRDPPLFPSSLRSIHQHSSEDVSGIHSVDRLSL